MIVRLWLLKELDDVNAVEGQSPKDVLCRLVEIFRLDISPQDIDNYFNEIEIKQTLNSDSVGGEQNDQEKALVVIEGYYKKYLLMIDKIF